VAGDGLGDTSTYALGASVGTPALAGTGIVGRTLSLTHASVQGPSVWFYDDWFRCDSPDTTCAPDPISRSTSSYTLAADDFGKYIDVRESFGFGFDEEGYLANQSLVSNIVGPIANPTPPPPPPPRPGRVTLTGSVSATRAGLITFSLRCAGGRCSGKLKLTYASKTIGSATYAIAAGQTAKIKVRLSSTGVSQLKKHKWRLAVKLVITPTRGTASTLTIELVAKH
jgi:hypothetical protein